MVLNVFRRGTLCLIWLVSLCLCAPVGATATPLVETEASHSKLAVYLETDNIAPGRSAWLAVHIEPRDGWHTYWLNPGDSGAAPILDWTLPAGLQAAAPLYGTPHAIPTGPLVNYGYDGPSSLLVRLDATGDVASAMPVHLYAEWLVCATECVPQFAELDLSFTAGAGAMDPANAGIFSKARSALPEPSYWDARLEVGAGQSGLTVFMATDEADGLESVQFFPAAEGVLTYAAPQAWILTGEGLGVRLERAPGAPQPGSAAGVLVLGFRDGTHGSYDLSPELVLSAASTSTADPAGVGTDSFGLPLWQAALFALLGGLILNLMPCVFPILSLKAFAFISANQRSVASRRADGWAYTGGIWVSFMVIVGILMLLRAGGAAIGWGFQLQEPLFVAFLALLMVFVALSLGGMFHIRLGIENAGAGLAAEEGSKGAFFKGVLAALVATPCTAPLMAPAIGFALTQPAVVVFTIFSLLALGLALPFLALSYSETLARMMPRPGAWMEKVKEALAFPMLLTAAWLVYIFDQQAGSAATFLLIAMIITAAFAVWLWQQGTGPVLRLICVALLLAAVFGFVRMLPLARTSPAAQVEAGDDNAYSPAALDRLLAAGEPVFVYFTADWCITCKVNEKLVLDRDETAALFSRNRVRILKGDWTNKNAAIANVLAEYGRAGVPLYLYYAPGQRKAVVLPEVLTLGAIEDALATNP